MRPAGPETHHVELSGVPETLLWTLFNRATEARRADSVLSDPEAVRLLDSIDFPFERRFGKPRWAQAQALRARCFDDEVHEFLAAHPEGRVVALGEGLETQFWRVDNGKLRWITVDLPDVVELRSRLLPADPRLSAVAASALDECWIDEAGTDAEVLITAQGLLMYLPLEDVRRLIGVCARRLPGATMIFDAIPHWLSASTTRPDDATGDGYRPPPMLWGMDAGELVSTQGLHPPGTIAVEVMPPRGRGVLFGWLLPLVSRIRTFREKRLPFFPWVIIRLSFPDASDADRDVAIVDSQKR